MSRKWAFILLTVAGLVAYGNTLQNGLFWDDDEFIKRNEYIRSFRYLPQWFSQPLTAGAGVNSNYYRPLLQFSFAIDYKLWKLWPAGYHLENLALHTFAAILLYDLLRRLLTTHDSRFTLYDASVLAFITSLIWLIHPIQVEAVAYANSRGDLLATVFILLSLIYWIKQRHTASAIAFTAALLSKEFAVVTPGLIVLIESLRGASATWQSHQIPTDRRSVGPRNDKKIKVFLLFTSILALYITLRLTVLNFQNTLNYYGVDLSRVDLASPIARYATSASVRLLTFAKALSIYGQLLVWPADLHMERTVDIAISLGDITVLATIAFVATLLVLCSSAVYQGFTLRDKVKPFWVARPFQILPFAVGWFFISIIPVSGLIPISQILSEHFLYLPSIGFFLIATYIIAVMTKTNKAAFFTIITLISALLLIKTISQNRIWRDPITFYEHTLSRATPTARVHNNLAMAYAEAGNHAKAIENYQAAIAMGDVYPNPHYNLANTYMELGNFLDAETEYQRALEIDPNFHYATLKLGQVYIDQGKIDEAKKLVCPIFPTQPLCQIPALR